ncbi:hypothetical protein [Sphingomonas oryzagri]|uniref:Holin n=1 Tax=Sphingomonas oryzagri TaxID=3042314 RepID=A0ABT6N2H9_9SPHN|nr:hypothetical protein [Sphingomonas oryzagri]MDH7638974.1 hypothetical protein [Sphingomonas oryzagri]
MNILNALKGAGGEFEVNRTIGAVGALAYVLGAHAFVAWSLAKGEHFDLTAYCLAFPGGLGVVVGSTAGAVAVKDRAVATSKIIADTGAVPAPPPLGPKVPVEQQV